MGPRAGTWLLACPTTLTFCLFSDHFFITLRTCFGLPHPIVVHLSWCQCGHTIDDLGPHLFLCPCGSECIAAHNTLRDTNTTIVLESGAHVQKEVSYLFPHHTW